MALVRYARTLDQVKQLAEKQNAFLESTVTSLRCVYETDPAIAAAVVPRPLEPVAGAQVCVTLSHVAMHITPEFTMEIGSAVFGVRSQYEGVEGIYLITMPMTSEAAVVSGRETYGEPKKIADIDFDLDGDRVSARVARMGMTYLELRGTRGADLGPREFTEYGYCYKALPACEKRDGFEADPLLVRLEWRHTHEQACTVGDGEVILRESPIDPVADLPVRRLLRLEYERGRSESNGRVLRSVPSEWLLPFWHGRYDDASGVGVEVS